MSDDLRIEEDPIQIKRNVQLIPIISQFHLKENDWKKDKALYIQKIQLLEMQLEDYKQREENHRKLNDTITSAINDAQIPNKQKVFADFQKTIESLQKELLSAKAKSHETIALLEQQIRSLNEQVQEKDNSIKETELQFQRQYIQYDHRISVLEQEKQTLTTENYRFKEQLSKQEDNYKSKEQTYRQQIDQEVQKIKEKQQNDENLKQQDYELKYTQLQQLFEKEKEALQQRILKCQNTIKKYQTHIESNIDVTQMQSKYEEQVKNLQQELHEQQVQFQYEKKLLTKQIDEIYHKQQSTSKKLEQNKFRNSVTDSPVQCKSFHINTDVKRQSQANQSMIISKCNQSFEKQQPRTINENLPIAYDEFNKMQSKKVKSLSTNSIQTNQLTSYLQDASLVQHKEDSFQVDDNQNMNMNMNNMAFKHSLLKQALSNQQTTRDQMEPQRRSISQQGFKSSVNNLSKILGQSENTYIKTTTSSSQIKTNNTSFTHFKVPAFTQNQLNSIRNSQQYPLQPCTTLRANDNHLNHIQSIKARYVNSEELRQDTNQSYIKQNKENQLPSKSMHINNEIKFLIGRLLQAKGKLTNELENLDKSQAQKSFRYTKRFE